MCCSAEYSGNVINNINADVFKSFRADVSCGRAVRTNPKVNVFLSAVVLVFSSDSNSFFIILLAVLTEQCNQPLCCWQTVHFLHQSAVDLTTIAVNCGMSRLATTVQYLGVMLRWRWARNSLR